MPFRVRIGKSQVVWKTGGWGENYWNNLSGLDTCQANALLLYNALVQLTPPQTNLTYIRISAAQPPPQVRNVKDVQIPSVGGFSAASSDYPSTALQVVLTNAAGKTTTQWLRGIPDSVVRLGVYAPWNQIGWAPLINNFLGLLVNSQWQMRILNPANPFNPCGNFDPVLGVLQYAGPQLGVDQALVKVRISRFASPSAVNGLWTAVCHAGPPQSISLVRWQPLPAGTIVDGKSPTVRLQTYVFTPIVKAEIGAATSHYTGKPGALLGGRKRKKKKIGV